MLLQCVYGIIHVKRGRTYKKCCLCQAVQREEWIVELGVMWAKTAT